MYATKYNYVMQLYRYRTGTGTLVHAAPVSWVLGQAMGTVNGAGQSFAKCFPRFGGGALSLEI